MINVYVFRKQNAITAFELSGHAESGPYGHDLVCAAVSAVSFGAVNAVSELCQIDLDIDQGEEGGYLRVALPSHLEQSTKEKAMLLLEGMVVSLETIERDYGEFIKIHYK
ncbi:MAG TPA: ribosomal-processing cysteine protease Prp [Cerasibacillus sp.]|uniref:ribosomal-processing cysteine protease Prp n=1 Tax=Cerasibacillus sp. TaxID=2498711 RepID=UPI002F3FA05F